MEDENGEKTNKGELSAEETPTLTHKRKAKWEEEVDDEELGGTWRK